MVLAYASGSSRKAQGNGKGTKEQEVFSCAGLGSCREFVIGLVFSGVLLRTWCVLVWV